MKTLSALLSSITPDEMLSTFDHLLDCQDAEGGMQRIGGYRMKIAQQFPIFGALFGIDDPAFHTDPARQESIIGFQFAGTWIAAVAERREDQDLLNALIAIEPQALITVFDSYQSQDPGVMMDDMRTLGEKYPFLPIMFNGYEFVKRAGVAGAGVCIFLLGTGLCRLAEDSR